MSKQDEQITASSIYDDGEHYLPPEEGRLNNVENNWATKQADHQSYHWIQVDFQDATTITGIQTQGDGFEDNEWVTELQIQSGDSEDSLTYIMEGNDPKTFAANTDRNTVVTITFSVQITARYLRIVPTDWHGWVSMRFEVIGCRSAATTSKATTTTDKATTSPYLSTSPSDERTSQPSKDLSTVFQTSTSKTTSATKKVTTTFTTKSMMKSLATSSTTDSPTQSQKAVSGTMIIGVAVGLSIALMLIIISVLFALKLIRVKRGNQTKPVASTAKPTEVNQPYYLTVFDATPNQPSDSSIKQPVYADPNQENPPQDELYHDITESATGDDPNAIYYSSVEPASIPQSNNGQVSNTKQQTKGKTFEAPGDASLYYATSDTQQTRY
ncbi:uncharacterized protein [Amphiura filiformis]|uniref:uncharacterized protein n=1 Tax=Amphiura filiformis TaxID=82378 RepID=UPI003B20DCFF